MEEEFIFSSERLSDFDTICADIRRAIKAGDLVSGVFVRKSKDPRSWLAEASAQGRKTKKLTQQEVSGMAGLSGMTISNFEAGKSIPHNWKKILRICGVQLTHSNFAPATFIGVPFGTAANMVRFKSKESVKSISVESSVTQKKYRAFEKGVDMTFEETERVLGYLGFTAL